MKLSDRMSPDVPIATVLLVLAGLSILFLDFLVAPPKTLMGRSMTAISPSMFPNIVLFGLVILCALFLAVRVRHVPVDLAGGLNTQGWQDGVFFFALLTFYALAMAPLGFLVSSSTTMAAISWRVGNRSATQIIVLSLAAPVMLYLAATRLLAVSLPELDALELFYARLLG